MSVAENVTIHVPTAVADLTALTGGEPDDAMIAELQRRQINGQAARIQELEIAVGTLTNIVGCAVKALADAGLSDEGASDQVTFSHDLSDRMIGVNVAIGTNLGGGLVVRLAPRAPDAIQLAR